MPSMPYLPSRPRAASLPTVLVAGFLVGSLLAFAPGCSSDDGGAASSGGAGATTGAGGGTTTTTGATGGAGGGGGGGQAASCGDGQKNGAETDVDCGGCDLASGTCDGATRCAPCAQGATCKAATDCVTQFCSVKGVCDAPPSTCGNGQKDGDETDVDCGGGCAAGAPPSTCADGKACGVDGDCTGGSCKGGVCSSSDACSDGAKSGDETDVDCGGSCAKKCAYARACAKDGDCASGTCTSGTCTGCTIADEAAVCGKLDDGFACDAPSSKCLKWTTTGFNQPGPFTPSVCSGQGKRYPTAAELEVLCKGAVYSPGPTFGDTAGACTHLAGSLLATGNRLWTATCADAKTKLASGETDCSIPGAAFTVRLDSGEISLGAVPADVSSYTCVEEVK